MNENTRFLIYIERDFYQQTKIQDSLCILRDFYHERKYKILNIYIYIERFHSERKYKILNIYIERERFHSERKYKICTYIYSERFLYI